MDIYALITSVGINIVLCVVLLLLHSILKKLPSNVRVYFGGRLASRKTPNDPICFEKFIPSRSWIVEAFQASEEELLRIGGMDAVVFLRIIVFSIRIFLIVFPIWVCLLLPVNYFGQVKPYDHSLKLNEHYPFETFKPFTIENIKEGSKWLWTYCLALYIITCSACILLYNEYKSIAEMRLAHITGSPTNPSHFTVLVRAIPCSSEESCSDSVQKIFTNDYLSHQMVHRYARVEKPTGDASALVFFKTRYAATVAAQASLFSNSMLWVRNMAPEPQDVYWPNLEIPYRQLWFRKMGTLVAITAFIFLFLYPVAFVQLLAQLEEIEKTYLHRQISFPLLEGLLKKKYMTQLVTGYLPSLILHLAMSTVPPIMMQFSTLEGYISRSGRQKTACYKIFYFTIWNVFFVNAFVGFLIVYYMGAFSSVKDIAAELANAIPRQVCFFMTYVLSYGWTSLACELMQIFSLFYNLGKRFIPRVKDDSCNGTSSFPYHKEVPRLLFFGFLGFTCSILAPPLVPYLTIYFFLAYLVYRNQILNVYVSKYDTGGQFWPVVHNTTIFSLIVSQIIAVGVFGIKRSPVASIFTIPLIICTLIFNEHCRRRFHPIFKNNDEQILIKMDQEDEKSGKMEKIHQLLISAYQQK
ncbi:hypothetical protein RGQ29_008569 [Quercus rubra]|uniref:CSC1-like protein RXW8 n=1 Tax=Quercus rubra TaxID=3512 RepID=A0AAN7I5F0_QUERU|nr:hypothetical protein RGQ29_008569 [Quercus rubra]KAK4559407.1 hypothetical protein RGQ29_008569 [Quercus rubra]